MEKCKECNTYRFEIGDSRTLLNAFVVSVNISQLEKKDFYQWTCDCGQIYREQVKTIIVIK